MCRSAESSCASSPQCCSRHQLLRTRGNLFRWVSGAALPVALSFFFPSSSIFRLSLVRSSAKSAEKEGGVASRPQNIRFAPGVSPERSTQHLYPGTQSEAPQRRLIAREVYITLCRATSQTRLLP